MPTKIHGPIVRRPSADARRCDVCSGAPSVVVVHGNANCGYCGNQVELCLDCAHRMLKESHELVGESQGWVVSDGRNVPRYRTWDLGSPEWTREIDEATHYLRRQDAEAAHAEDEDAWRVFQHTPGLAEPPTSTMSDEALARIGTGQLSALTEVDLRRRIEVIAMGWHEADPAHRYKIAVNVVKPILDIARCNRLSELHAALLLANFLQIKFQEIFDTQLHYLQRSGVMPELLSVKTDQKTDQPQGNVGESRG